MQHSGNKKFKLGKHLKAKPKKKFRPNRVTGNRLQRRFLFDLSALYLT